MCQYNPFWQYASGIHLYIQYIHPSIHKHWLGFSVFLPFSLISLTKTFNFIVQICWILKLNSKHVCVSLYLYFDCVENWMLSTHVYILIDLTFEKRFLAVSWMAVSIFYFFFFNFFHPLRCYILLWHIVLKSNFKVRRKMYAVNMKIYFIFFFVLFII